MLDIKNTYEKANRLMEGAMAKYAEGDFRGGDADRDSANKLYEQARKEINSQKGKDDILYGENRNFAIIYKVLEENSVDMFKKKKDNPKLANVVNYIKGNKVLVNEMKVLNALMYPKYVADPVNYVTEALSFIQSKNKKQIVKENNRLIQKIRELGINEMVDINDDEITLLESIGYVMNNAKSLSNLTDYVNHKQNIIEHVKSVCESENKELTENIDDIYSKLTTKVNEGFEKLNDDEKSLVEQINGTEDKKGLFEETKRSAIKMLQEKYDSCSTENKDKINGIINTINERKYNEDTILSDIAEMVEIKNVLL